MNRMNRQDEAGYEAQLNKMRSDVLAWRKTHTDKSPSIQYNYPAGTCVIAALADAIDNHYVSVNDDARQMLTDLGWLTDGPDEMPTVLMARVVLEVAFK